MPRPLAYDATHLVTRWKAAGSAGIGRVDLAFARHFATHPRLACGAHYGLRGPHVLAPERLPRLVDDIAPGDRIGADADRAWASLRAFLLDRAPVAPTAPRDGGTRIGDMVAQTRLRLAHDMASVPDSALYLNIAQHGCEFPILFEWLARRPDVRAVFFLHDLLPLDHPEFFRPGYETLFRRRLATIIRHAHGILTTSETVAERVEREIASRGAPRIAIHAQPLPSTLGDATEEDADPELARSDYFVAVSTIEPRKNHLLLLDVWRALAATGAPAPKLVLVGGTGWENERVLDMLQRSAPLRRHARLVSGLSSAALRRLIGHANALLMPSFAEGYGLPIVEALSLGVPAIVSDIAAFREVAQNRAVFLSPIDGLGWKRAIDEFADRGSPRRLAALRDARAFAPPDRRGYFAATDSFLDTL